MKIDPRFIQSKPEFKPKLSPDGKSLIIRKQIMDETGRLVNKDFSCDGNVSKKLRAANVRPVDESLRNRIINHMIDWLQSHKSDIVATDATHVYQPYTDEVIINDRWNEVKVKLPFGERVFTYIYNRRHKYKLFDRVYKFMYSRLDANIREERNLRVDMIHDEFGENLPLEFDPPLCHVRDDRDPVDVKNNISDYSMEHVETGIYIPGFKTNKFGEHVIDPEYKPEFKVP